MYWERRGDAVGKWREVGWGQGMAFFTYRREREREKKEAAATKKPRESEQGFSES